jgi:ATPase subunit of ABC transporter with duplicated ATPase domains
VKRRYDANVWLDVQPSRRPVLLRMEEGTLARDTWSLTYPPLYLGNTDHVALVRDNGNGKSTLVRELVAHLPEHTRTLYVPQEPTEEQRTAVLARLRDLAPAERGRVLSVVAQLNSDPDRVLEGGVVSPGELRKLMLALGMLNSPELIVMDEPTNHLDLGSTLALERVLRAYPGALVLVSHDAALVEATTDITWRIAGAGGSYQLTVV